MRHINWFIVHFIFGLWLFISPYFLNFTHLPGAYWNAIILGLVFTLSSGIGLYYGHEEITLPGESSEANKA